MSNRPKIGKYVKTMDAVEYVTFITNKLNKPQRCPKCKQTKDRSEFYPNERTYSKLSSWCRQCTKDKGRLVYKSYKDHLACQQSATEECED